MKFCGEIAYTTTGKEHGLEYETPIHSDICFNCGPSTEIVELTDENRKFLHDCLDEWLNKSNGTGVFWIGDSSYFSEWSEWSE